MGRAWKVTIPCRHVGFYFSQIMFVLWVKQPPHEVLVHVLYLTWQSCCSPPPASEHNIYNISPLQIHWKLCVFCLLCEAYLRWSLLHGSEQSNDPADIIRYTKEWEFYGMFGLAALGKIWSLLYIC